MKEGKLEEVMDENGSFTDVSFLMQVQEKVAPLLLKNCVVGWENVVDEEGKPLPFNDENFDLITDLELITELVNFIDTLSTIKKTSESG